MINSFKIPEGLTGSGVTVGICDSWCDLSHSLFKGRKISHKSFLVGKPLYSYDKHGTHITGIIAKIAPECTIVLAETAFLGKGMFPSLTESLEWLMSEDVKVVNLSLSYTEDNSSVRNILSKMADRGVIMCASCGKEPGMFPASYGFVVSVDSHFNGVEADTYAPHEFKSSVPGGGEAVIGGTSMSCACISAVAALYVQDGGYGKDGFMEWMQKKAGAHYAPAQTIRKTTFVR
jgi:subtilisin family serine protease